MAPALQLEDQTARTPAAVRGAQLADHRLDLGAQLPRVRLRRVGAVSQPGQPALAVTGHPAVHRLAGHPEPLGHLSDRNAVKNLKNSLVPLLDHVQLPKHERECHPSSEAVVSHIKRSLTWPSAVGMAVGMGLLRLLYGFKGARLRLPPGAGRARRGIELETRSAVEACVGSASVTTRARA
jgi:hypothetical protein